MDSTTLLVVAAALILALTAGYALGLVRGGQQARRDHGDLREGLRGFTAEAVHESQQQVDQLAVSRLRATEQVVGPVRETLERLAERLHQMESHDATWQAQLKQQVEAVQLSGIELRQQTAALAEALRRPQVRGHWGEMQLRRSLELAGVTSHCVFEEQATVRGADGALRPDVVILLTGGKLIVVDSKVSLDAFLCATGEVDPDAREAHLKRHAQQVRRHVDTLSSKEYWRQFESTPEFVVMFLPGEAIFAQALETDPSLIDYAAGKRVVIATPTTIIAMLKTVAYTWTQEAVAANAREVHRLGRELYDRLGAVGRHLDKLGRSLTSAVGSYNSAVGSLETRVLVSARRMRDLQVTDDPLPPPQPVVEGPRPLTAPELVGLDDANGAIEGPPGREQWTRRVVGE